MLAENEPAQITFSKADRQEQCQFATTFENIAQKNHTEAKSAEQQAESAEHLKCSEISILHCIERAESLFGAGRFESGILYRFRQSRRHRFRAIGRSVDEEHSIAG